MRRMHSQSPLKMSLKLFTLLRVCIPRKQLNEDLLVPAREGPLNIVWSAATEASVKRVVITSSFAAMNQLGTDPYAEPHKKCDESV